MQHLRGEFHALRLPCALSHQERVAAGRGRGDMDKRGRDCRILLLMRCHEVCKRCHKHKLQGTHVLPRAKLLSHACSAAKAACTTVRSACTVLLSCWTVKPLREANTPLRAVHALNCQVSGLRGC